MQDFVFQYTLNFTLQLIFCVYFFVMKYPKRNYFVIRIGIGIILYFILAYYFLILFQSIPFFFNGLNIVYFFILIFMIWSGIGFVYDVSAEEILFAGIGGYAVQHIGYSIENIAYCFLNVKTNYSLLHICLLVLPYVAVSLIVYVIIKQSSGKGELKGKDKRMIILAFIVLFSNVVLSLLVDMVHMSMGDRKNIIIYSIYAMICSGLALYIEFNLSSQNKLQHDNEIMEYMLHLNKEQKEISKENIELIKIKCHDLKHQLTKLSEIDDKAQQQSFLNEMRQNLAIYSNLFTTGNEALDLILAEKSLICENYGISFSCMVDGESLNFISTPDIYSLFGNALDNAIESVMKEKNKEKRIISMKAYEHNDMLYIHIDNRCTKKPVFKEGLPVTTKENKLYHGYGVKSIKRITEKYGGDVRIYVKEKQFHLDILFNDVS